MRKIFLAALIMFTLCIPNFCGAVNISRVQNSNHDKIFYPQVHMSNAAVEKKINVAILAEIDRFITGVYRNAQVNNYEVVDIRADYQIGSHEAGGTVILSVVFTKSNYYKGGAHPATTKHAMNFNVQTGELMDISYLTDIGEGVDKADLINMLEQKLRKQCARENRYLFPEALPLKKLPDEFYWDENLHVHFIFNHYEIAPYAAGIIDVDIDG